MRSAGGVKAAHTPGQGNCVLIRPCAARRSLTRRHESILHWLYQRPSAAAPAAVSRNYSDRKWRIVCDPRPFESAPTFKTRAEAAYGERELIEELAKAAS